MHRVPVMALTMSLFSLRLVSKLTSGKSDEFADSELRRPPLTALLQAAVAQVVQLLPSHYPSITLANRC